VSDRSNGKREIVNYTYDKNGRLIKEDTKDEKNKVTSTEYTYNDKSLVVSEVYTDKAGKKYNYTHKYDDKGTLIESTCPENEYRATINPSYDENGRLAKESINVDGDSYSYEYEYNSYGNVAKQIYTASNENVETYEYKIFYRPNNPINENMLIDG